MSHYDLYSALGLDRNHDSEHLTTDIDDRLSHVDDGSAQAGELQLARTILGDQDRRNTYDRQLDNPDAPDITVEAVRQLAEFTDTPAADDNSEAAEPSPPQSGSDSEVPSKDTKIPVKSWTILTIACSVVVGVIVALISWGITANREEPAAETETVTEKATSTVTTEDISVAEEREFSLLGENGELITESSKLPQVNGLEISDPENEVDNIRTMLTMVEWWFDDSTTPEDRENYAGYMLYLANENSKISDSRNTFLAQVMRDLLRSGYTVNQDNLTTNQRAARTSFGIDK